MTFPRFKLNITEDVSPIVAARRADFARGPLAKRLGLTETVSPDTSPEAEAEAFGLEMFRRCGKNWPEMVARASGAAMLAERAAMEGGTNRIAPTKGVVS